MQEIVRAAAAPVESMTVTRDGQQRRVLRGTAAVYYDGSPGSEYNLMPGVVERIAPGAFDEALKAGPDVRAAVNHDTKETIARTPQTLKVWSDSRGLQYEADLPNTRAANDAWESISHGIIRGSSFKARVDLKDKSSVSWSKEGDRTVMTIKRFAQLVDVAPVVDPAYTATDVQAIARSRDEWLAEQETAKRLERAKQIINHSS